MFRTNGLIYFFVTALIAVALIASVMARNWVAAALLIAPLIYLWRNAAPARAAASSTPIRIPAARRSEPDTYREMLWKNLVFRSNSEVKIAKTLDHRNIFFIPPGRVRMSAGKDGRQSRELDFVICYAGKWGVLEVDGPYHRPNSTPNAMRCCAGTVSKTFSVSRQNRCYNDPNAVIDEFIRNLSAPGNPAGAEFVQC